jgi:hypothetical protein
MTQALRDRPLIIIGAPRSGTNMLRDAMVSLGPFHTWPCDELNPMWLHKNRDASTDQLLPEHARPDVVARIRRTFHRRASARPEAALVEKTCANSLRVPFVAAVLPESRFVFIVRDGREAAASAIERWKAPLDWAYTARKVRFAPAGDIPQLAHGLVRNRISQRGNDQNSLSMWGPNFDGLSDVLKEHGLAAACAAQWARCVSLATEAADALDQADVFRVRYEDFVEAPESSLAELAAWAGRSVTTEAVTAASAPISASRGGRWDGLSSELRAAMRHQMAPALALHGYGS